MKQLLIALLLSLPFYGLTKTENIEFHPIQHASLVIEYNHLTIFVDPAGNMNKYKPFAKPDIVLITHTHGDHLNPEMLNALKSQETTVIGNKKAVEMLGYGIEIHNFEKTTSCGIEIEAIPMYNTSEDRLNQHPQGRGNGYILTLGDKRVYISGDTEDTQEVRALKNIDHAFLCMNLPFTMTPEQAAKAVLAFKPAKVYPYHYSQKDGFSDIEKFKRMVEKAGYTEVILLDWYDEKN